MTKTRIWIAAIGFLGIAFLISQDTMANFAWKKRHSPAIALMLAARDEKLLMSLGNYYFNGGAYDLRRAKKAYEKALRVDPKILWGHYQLARILFVKGDGDAAIDEINKELEVNPENLRSLYVRGLIYGYRNSAGDLERAAEDFSRFTAWAPSEWAGYNDLAWILSKAGRYQEAKEAIQNAFASAPNATNNPWLWNSLGVAELNLGEYKNAERSFERAIELAGKLSLADWRRSYPGNDPASADSGLDQFKEALGKNRERAKTLGAM
ncbi:MAG: hypothetical protein UY71_C0001G0059 [Parcubacteria group bacterium GW2011_GWB1_52_7]|nr:MAG: hypothetical protein UY64_C0014G0020 [Parcubacteria group bacterium GW2011_GWA1_51_12]KKW29249.1 MAG: hypothetical protein UY71_C0001G0059 [Parcubacteria group bacterium GW2011_GWB1_52_7]